MLRHSVAQSRLLAEVSVVTNSLVAPLSLSASRLGRNKLKGALKTHAHITYSKMGPKVPKPITPPELLTLGKRVSSSMVFGDMTKAREFQYNTRSLNSRRFLMTDGRALIGGKLAVSRVTSKILAKTFEQFQLGVQNSMLHTKSKADSVPQKAVPKKAPKTSGVLPKKRAKSKGSVTTTVMDEYGYNYDEDEHFPITAYAVCEEFDLKAMHKGLISQGLYIPTVLLDDLTDVIHVSAKYPIGDEPREIFFFREGSVVFWNVPYLEIVNVLKFLKEYEDESYGPDEIEEETEYMNYVHCDQGSTRLVRGRVYLGNDSSNKLLEKYAFANALASSVKLGMWESTLEKYVEGIENITEALKRAEAIKLSRGEVLQKTGELFALRHQLNLNSDLLDTPDFYWEREKLETLYQKTCDYLSIHRRTKVMNEKLNQCCELLDLISSHLTDEHHTRLEWMIIVLIMIEVGFEILHLLERYELIHS